MEKRKLLDKKQKDLLEINKKINGELIPVPEEFGAGCGLAFRFEDENFEKIKKILDEENVSYKILKILDI